MRKHETHAHQHVSFTHTDRWIQLEQPLVTQWVYTHACTHTHCQEHIVQWDERAHKLIHFCLFSLLFPSQNPSKKKRKKKEPFPHRSPCLWGIITATEPSHGCGRCNYAPQKGRREKKKETSYTSAQQFPKWSKFAAELALLLPGAVSHFSSSLSCPQTQLKHLHSFSTFYRLKQQLDTAGNNISTSHSNITSTASRNSILHRALHPTPQPFVLFLFFHYIKEGEKRKEEGEQLKPTLILLFLK